MTLQQYVYWICYRVIQCSNLLIRVPKPIMCSASTMVQSLELSGLKPGQWAVFPGGGGGVGIQGVRLAKAMGFRPIAIDTGEDKRELCTRLGAEAFIDL
jgi:propanol-preferring alcohol dehydrogenase